MCLHYDVLSDSETSRKYFNVAKSIGERFVAESTAQARRFDPSEFSSMIVCSRLLVLLGFAFYRTHRTNGVPLSDAGAWTWLHLLRGVNTVYAAIAQSNVELDPLLSANMIPELPQHRSSDERTTACLHSFRHSDVFRIVSTSRHERIRELYTCLSTRSLSFNAEAMNDLQTAIVSLEEVTTYICAGEVQSLFRAIGTWPGSVSNGFTNMLLKNEPFALTIYAHWLMLVALARDMWWFDDMESAGIQEVAAILSNCDQSLLPLLEWPVKIVEVLDN